MKILHKLCWFLICIYLISGCKNGNPETMASDIANFKKLVSNWDIAHNTKDITVFSNLYDNSILFYGIRSDKNACIESKLSLFKKYPDYYEQVFGDIQTESLNDSSVKCSFIKRVTINHETKDYPAYLTFNKVGNDWKIIVEGDLTTDKNIDKKTDIPVSNNSGTNLLFVKGLSQAAVYTKEQAENGSEFIYKDGRTFRIKFYFEQVAIFFYSFNENNQKANIETEFEVGYKSDGEMSFLKDNTKFLVGQYDFDGDDIDELIIALQDNDPSGSNGISVDIFKLQNDSWNRIGALTGGTIGGEPIAEVKRNMLTIKRHLRGFYYQWTLESGKFKDTGYY